jgi:DNA-binding NarL/FixJ family response regulator
MTSASRTIRVLVVDDHPVVREGLVALLSHQPDLEVVGEAGDGEAAVKGYREQRPDVTLMDLRMGRMSGLEALTSIRRDFPDAHILILTTFDSDEEIYRAFQAGARGYLLKYVGREELLAAVRTVAAGGRHVPQEVAERLVQRIPGTEITARELAVLKLIVFGRSNKRIAAALGITEGTVKTHVATILGKLGVADRTEAAVQAIRRGIVALPATRR